MKIYLWVSYKFKYKNLSISIKVLLIKVSLTTVALNLLNLSPVFFWDTNFSYEKFDTKVVLSVSPLNINYPLLWDHQKMLTSMDKPWAYIENLTLWASSQNHVGYNQLAIFSS